MPKWHYIEIKSEHHILVKQPWQMSWVLRWLPKLLDNSLHLAVWCLTFWDILVLLIGFSHYIRKNKAQKYYKLYLFNDSTTPPWACQWRHFHYGFWGTLKLSVTSNLYSELMRVFLEFVSKSVFEIAEGCELSSLELQREGVHGTGRGSLSKLSLKPLLQGTSSPGAGVWVKL